MTRSEFENEIRGYFHEKVDPPQIHDDEWLCTDMYRSPLGTKGFNVYSGPHGPYTVKFENGKKVGAYNIKG